MPSGNVMPLAVTTDVERTEAPVTLKGYLLCAFASFGGIFFGYESGYINGVNGMTYFIHLIQGPNATALSSPHQSLITSILSAGTFFGAVFAGDIADRLGRRMTIMLGCLIYYVGVILQAASHGLGLIVAGRVIAGIGMGFVSAIIVLYMSEIAPRKIRGTLVSGYQQFITIGLLLAACVDQATKNRTDTGSYRIPICIQFLWSTILFVGLIFLPDSPRFYIMQNKPDKARDVLVTLRGQPAESEFIEMELAELLAYQEFERRHVPQRNWWQSYMACFEGSLWEGSSALRCTILGTSIQMMQQWTGVNFIFYFSTAFLESTGAIKNPFIISLIFTLINVLSTPLSFYIIEVYGRRAILLVGASGMLFCQLMVGIIGDTVGFNHTHSVIIDGNPVDRANNVAAVNAQIAFICFFIVFFATTWGPAAWVLIGEIFPIGIRSRGVGLSTASNWLWNCLITVITPYMVNKDKGNLKSNVFFLWGGLCTCALVYTYYLVPETKGLSLEQTDRMLAESTPRTSRAWRAHQTYAENIGAIDKEGHFALNKGPADTLPPNSPTGNEKGEDLEAAS